MLLSGSFFVDLFIIYSKLDQSVVTLPMLQHKMSSSQIPNATWLAMGMLPTHAEVFG
jgi:hypothetical protein